MTATQIILLVCACIWGISAIINFICIFINRRQAKKENVTSEFLNSIIEYQKEYIEDMRRALELQEVNTIYELLTEIGNIPYDEMHVGDFDWYVEICEKYGVKK